MLCRFLDEMVAVRLTYLEPRQGFVWVDPPTNNYVDEKINAKLKMLSIPPSDLCSDHDFIRRASLDLCAVLLARCGHMQGKQMSQRIDRSMHLRALASLGAVVAGPPSRLRRRLQGAAIHDHRRRLWLGSGELTQQRAHILHQDLEDPGPHPALRLLIDRRPR